MNDSVLKKSEQYWPAFLCLAVAIGIFLRLCFPQDIEYKGDERYMFQTVQQIKTTGAWPLLGMSSGVAVKNPGMSLWIFVVLSKIIHASTPPDLARAVQLLNGLGLVLLAFFSLRLLPEIQSAPWRWSAALAAVNPFTVILQRKIWAQCTLPFFCVLFWIAWHYRHKKTGAFFWGLFGACLGQIHMSGFFLAAGVFGWTAYHDRKIRWGAWGLGSLVAAIPLIPWFQYMAAKPETGFQWIKLLWIVYPRYWFYWATDSFGWGLNYFLSVHKFFDFLRYPLIDGTGTYLVGFLHVGLITLAVLILVSAKKNGGLKPNLQDTSENGLAIYSALLASGVLMTLSCVEIFRHYLIMTYPLEWVWLSRLSLRDTRRGQYYLAALWLAQLLMTVSFLFYIHLTHGDPSGDYGIAYQFQTP
jgi:hypothetical protein